MSPELRAAAEELIRVNVEWKNACAQMLKGGRMPDLFKYQEDDSKARHAIVIQALKELSETLKNELAVDVTK